MKKYFAASLESSKTVKNLDYFYFDCPMSTSFAVVRFYCVFWGQGEVTVDRKHSFRRVMLFSWVCPVRTCGHF